MAPIKPLMVVAGQTATALGALAAMAMMPPTSGRMMVIPLTRSDIVPDTVRAGALLLAPGPVAGSVVVMGTRAAIARRLSFPQAIVLAAPPALCGGGSEGLS